VSGGHLEIIFKTNNSQVKYVFKDEELREYFEKLIYDKMIDLEGYKRLRLQDVVKVRG
jgi:hypothetical protein